VPAPNKSFIAIAAGGNHSLGLKADGTVVGWGNNIYGQCTMPSPNSGFGSIAAGSFHTLGIK
jgi:alpha-tubulin suppressor-like RCC1 family protein